MTRHRPMLNRIGQLLAVTLGFACVATHATAADYPTQPIRLLVGFPPGGGADLYGRAIAQELGRAIGQSVVVENKPGAGGTIAAQVLMQAKPDGYTLLLGMSGNLGSAPAIRKSLPYKVPEQFSFVSALVETPYGLMVGGQSKIGTAKEYIEAAKGGKLSYASTGTGGASQIVMEMVKQNGKLDILHVPYKGSGPAMTDLMGGLVDSFFAPYTPLMNQIRSGKLRLLAISAAERLPDLPDVPTLKESGIDVVMTQWYGLVAPAGTPQPVIDTLQAAVKKAISHPDVLAVYRADGARESTRTGDDFRNFVVKDIANYRTGAERGGIKLD